MCDTIIVYSSGFRSIICHSLGIALLELTATVNRYRLDESASRFFIAGIAAPPGG